MGAGSVLASTVTALAVDHTNAQVVYAGTLVNGAYKSTDGGSTWAAINNGLGTGTITVRGLAVDPADAATLYVAADSKRIFKSVDGGANWVAADSGFTGIAMRIGFAGTTLYAAGSGGVFMSTTGGTSWTPVNNGLGGTPSISALASDPTAPQVLYAGVWGGGIFTSADGGSNWVAVNGGLPSPADASAFAPLPSGRMLAAIYNGGVYKSVAEPAAPTATTAVAGDGQASITWTAPVNDGGSPITSYTVTAVEDSTKHCTPSPATATACTVAGLTNGTAYTFTVTATNSLGTGSASGASAPVTPAGLPGVPTDVAAIPGAPGSGQVTLTWTAPSGNGSTIASYTVTPPGTGPACAVSPCIVSGLANAAQYSFTVQASNGVGAGAVSAGSSTVWLQGLNAITFQLQTGRAYVGGGTFAISPVATGLSSAPVTYGSQTPAVCTALGPTVTMVGAGTCILTANQLGDNAWSAAPQATQTVAIGLGVNAITFPTQASQTYSAGGTFAVSPVATGLSSAPVIYGSQTTSVCAVAGSTVTMVGSGTCTLTANQAGDANWAAAPQATQTVNIGATVPGAPTEATAVPGNGQATVSWMAPAATGGGITQYAVTAAGTTGCTALPPSISCTVPGLVNGTTYVFNVQAENGAGPSAAASTNPVTPLANSKAFAAPSPSGAGSVMVSVAGGGATCAFESVRLIQASSAGTAPPANLQFPHGLLDFVLAGCDPTDAALTITYPSPLPQGVRYWKLQGSTWAPYAGAMAAAGANTATVVLRDNGPGDDDGQLNGRIVDPGNVAVLMAGPGGTAAIPALSEWALVLLAGLVGWLGMRGRLG